MRRHTLPNAVLTTLKYFSALLMLCVWTHNVLAACSPYAGHASINEVHRNGNATRFVEIKILDTSITSATWNGWSIRLCNYAGTCSGNIGLNNAIDNSPWLVIDKPDITNRNFIDLTNGMDIILRDAGGNTIDYLSVVGYTGQQDSACSLPFDTTMTSTNTHTIERYADGTGDWRISGSGSSGGDTTGGTNDEAPGGGTPPTVTVNNATVVKGQAAAFTFSIAAAVGYDITINYQTLDNSAVAGTDYTATSGVATIIAGATATTVYVPTIAASSSGEVSFYFYVYNPTNGTLLNNYPTGTILANALAMWFMEQSLWTGGSGDVIDSSGNGYNGTAFNGANTANTNPAIPGTPGTCRYASFDGANDYVALSGFPNLTGSFTITAWIRANRINGDQRIFADDENNSNGFAFSLGDGGNGRLRFFSRRVSPVSLDSGAVIGAGTWYHVAVVHNATLHTRQIFVNGIAVTSAQTYTGTWGSDNGTASIGGETDGAGSEAVARWRFNGLIDEVRVYTSALNATAITTIMGQTRNCVSLDHIQIEHDGTGLTCEPETVTLRTCANADCSSVYAGDVNMTLTPSGWLGGDNVTISGGSGTRQLRHTSAGTLTLGVAGSAPTASNSVQCVNTATATADCNLVFHDTGFIYNIPTQTSCQTSGAITLSAVRADDTSMHCVPTFVSTTRDINFALVYSNPASGTNSLRLNHNSTAYTVNTGGVTVPVSFDASGQASLNLTYNDAGQISLNSRYTGTLAGGDAGLTMTGSTTYVTKPAKLYVYSDAANSDCASADVTCSAFVHAGAPFNLKIRAACDNAGTTVTPNFVLSGLTLTHDNIAPNIAEGTLGVAYFDINAADNGEHVITNQTVTEVGAFTFTAGLPAGGYFGETIGTTSLNTSANLGRFYPDHFCLTATTLTNRVDANTASGCSDGFTYLDEDLQLQFLLTAQAAGSACGTATVTQNYSGSWSRFATPFSEDTSNPNEPGKWNLAAVNAPTATPTVLNSRLDINTSISTPLTGSFSNGQASVSAVLDINRLGSAPAYTAETALTDVHLAAKPIDLDNVTLDTTSLTIGTDSYADLGTTSLYFGRLFAENAYGTNDAATPLDMYAHTQYCNGVSSGNCSDWQAKVDDSCTLYNVSPPAAVALGLNTAGDGLGGYYQRASAAVSSPIFNFDDTGASPSYARVHVPDPSAHSAGWRLFYTGGGDGGDYLIPFQFPFNTDPTVHPYLLHVDGIASFGHFRGDDRIIYWREILQ